MGFIARILGVEDVPRPDAGTAPGFEPSGGDFKSRVESVLDGVRPALQADGGDIELIAVRDRSAHVRLVGACQGCPSAALTLRFGIEKKLKEAIPDFEDLIPE
jgi:Fe-S cluster biogenesis protein NfuA